jgi:hypothetical protein
MRNVSDKFAEKIPPPPRKSCRLRDNVEKYGTAGQATADNIIRRMRCACWITKATDTHSEYVIFIAFARQQWLGERASMLRHKYISCLVFIYLKLYCDYIFLKTHTLFLNCLRSK